MGLSDKYRRDTDEPTKLLIVLNEKMSSMEKSIEKVLDVQAKSPCKTNSLRIEMLEKIMWKAVWVYGITLLGIIAKIAYSAMMK